MFLLNQKNQMFRLFQLMLKNHSILKYPQMHLIQMYQMLQMNPLIQKYLKMR
jgi:hypothetical protein